MHDAKHVLFVRRNGCQYLGTTASRRGAGVESPKEFTPPMQFRRFKDNSEELRRDRVRQLFEVRYAEERTETGVLLFYACWKSTTVNCSRNRNEATLISI